MPAADPGWVRRVQSLSCDQEVLDLAHVELGRLWLRVDETLSAVHVLADSNWIVPDAIDHRHREDELAHVVRAYPIPRAETGRCG